MYPEDRVLVGVINTKRDLKFARDAHWYRIPQGRMPRGISDEYLAFFLSGRVFKAQSGSIPYFARRQGVELARRKDLIPAQANHARAEDVYYKVNLGEMRQKSPPITNPTKRPVVFIHTTWDRFIKAEKIADLYSTADYFVDRIYHALQNRHTPVRRFWEAEREQTGLAPQVRILCQRGEVVASTEPEPGDIYLDRNRDEGEILRAIRAAIAANDGPVMTNLPMD